MFLEVPRDFLAFPCLALLHLVDGEPMVLHVVIVSCNNCNACRSFWPTVDPLAAVLGHLPFGPLVRFEDSAAPREASNWDLTQQDLPAAGPLDSLYPTGPGDSAFPFGREEEVADVQTFHVLPICPTDVSLSTVPGEFSQSSEGLVEAGAAEGYVGLFTPIRDPRDRSEAMRPIFGPTECSFLMCDPQGTLDCPLWRRLPPLWA